MAPLIAAAIIGAGATLASSGISAYSNYKSQEAEREAREKAANELKNQGAITDAQYNQLIDQINQYYNTRGSLGTQQDVNAYKQAIAGYNPEDYAADVGEFNYGKSVEDFTNPYYAQIIGQTRDTLQHSAAGAGLGRGTGAALGIAQGVASKSDELYNTALNQYNQDKQFEYQKYVDAIKNNQTRLNALNTAAQYKIGLQGNLASDYYNTQDAHMSDVMKAQQDRLNAQTSYASAISGLY